MPSFADEWLQEEDERLSRLKSMPVIDAPSTPKTPEQPKVVHSGSFADELLKEPKFSRTVTPPMGAVPGRESAQRIEQDRGRAFLEKQLPPGGKITPGQEAPFGQQFSAARLDTDEDIANYIRNPENKAIPPGANGGIIKTRGGESIPGYTLPDDPNFYPINTPGMSKGDLGYVAGKALNLENLLSVGSQFIPLVRGGSVALNVGKRLLTDVGASVAGRGADESIDVASGNQTFEGVGGKLTQSGLWGGASSLASQGVQGAVNKMRGVNSTLHATPEEIEARQYLEKASKELDAGQVNLGQMDVSDLWRRVNTVQRLINPKAAAKETQRRAATLKAFQAQIAKDVERGAIPVDAEGKLDYRYFAKNVKDETLFDIAQNYQTAVNQELRQKLSRKGMTGGVSQEEGGQSVLDGFYAPGGYNDIKTAEVSKAYDAARKAAVKTHAMYELKDIRKKVMDLEKKPKLIKETDEGQALESFDSITDPEVQSFLSKLRNVEEDQYSYFEGTKLKRRPSGQVMDDLIKIRSRLGEIYERQVRDGLVDVNGRAASKLYAIFSEALENPLSYRGPNPGELWKKANALHKEKMDTITSFNFGELAKEGKLGRGELAYRNIKPSMPAMTVAHMDTLKKIMPDTEFDKFKQAYYADILKNPMELSRRLDSLTEAENALLPEGSKNIIKLYANKLNKLNQDVVVKHLNTLENNTDRVKSMIADLQPREVDRVLKDMKIPKPVYRMHIMSDLLEKTTVMDKGILKLNPNKFMAEVKTLKESGHYKNLTPVQKRLVDNSQILNSFLKNTNDVATALNAGSIQAHRVEFHRPIRMAAARAEAATYAALGWLSERPFLVNRAIRPVPYKSMPYLRATVSLGMDAISELEKEATKKELPEFKGQKY